MTTTQLIPLILLGGGAFLLIGAAVHFTGMGSLNNIKSKTVGDGQHGTARWATKQEIRKTFRHVPFRPALWRQGKELPEDQGLVLGCVGGGKLKHSGKLTEKLRPLLNSRTKKAAAQKKAPSSKEPVQKEPDAKKRKTPQRKPKPKKERNSIQAIVDTDDIHCLMIGASGVGKTAFFL